MGSIPGSRRSPGGEHGNHSSILAWRRLQTRDSPQVCTESDTPEVTQHTHTKVNAPSSTIHCFFQNSGIKNTYLPEDICSPCAVCCAQLLSCVRLFVTPCTIAHQALLSTGILQARILEWVAMPSSRDLPNPGIKPRPPALQADSLLSEPPWKPMQSLLN